MRLRVVFVALVPGLLSGAAMAEAGRYRCSNAGIEVQCDAAGCAASERFTPISVTVDAEGLSICAYSGCWSGSAVMQHDATGLMVVGHDLRWSESGETATFRFMLRLEDMRAVVLGSSFAQPLTCDQVK